MPLHLPLSRLACMFTGALVLFAPLAASAGEEGGGVLFYGQGSFGNVHGQTLSIPWGGTEPEPLKDRELTLQGGGTIIGGGLRALVITDVLHGGLGVGMFGVQGLSLKHKALPPELGTSLGSTLGVNFEVYAGKELLDGPIHPYIDVRAVLTVLNAQVELHHPEYGLLGATPYNGYAFGIGPRAGVLVPLGSTFFVDLSGYFGIIGAERGGIFAGFGFWDR